MKTCCAECEMKRNNCSEGDYVYCECLRWLTKLIDIGNDDELSEVIIEACNKSKSTQDYKMELVKEVCKDLIDNMN